MINKSLSFRVNFYNFPQFLEQELHYNYLVVLVIFRDTSYSGCRRRLGNERTFFKNLPLKSGTDETGDEDDEDIVNK